VTLLKFFRPYKSRCVTIVDKKLPPNLASAGYFASEFFFVFSTMPVPPYQSADSLALCAEPRSSRRHFPDAS